MLYYADIIKGKGERLFAPDDYLTREEAATILYRVAEFLEVDMPQTAYDESIPYFLTSIDTTPVVWIIDILLILSGLLLCKNKWWGCIFGVVVGGILVYMGLQETGQIFKEYLIGFPLIIFYVVCGIYVANKTRR